MECITCKSPRVSRFVDFFGSTRIFCRNCWVSFPESNLAVNDTRKNVHINFGAIRRSDFY